MHKSGEWCWETLENLKRMNVVPTAMPEAPQMMNTRGGPNTL